jgi:hypothetical protein
MLIKIIGASIIIKYVNTSLMIVGSPTYTEELFGVAGNST